jgi:hypothetical protein
MEDVVLKLREQAKANGHGDAFTPSAAMTAKEVAAYFDREIPDAHMHFELCEDGVILTCDERCLGMMGTIKKDGTLTLTFPAGKDLEQVILSETEFQSRLPVLEGAARFVRSRMETGD